MSRSFRNTPIGGITSCKSEKDYKRIANRRHRHLSNRSDGEQLPLLREISNVYWFGKDGKHWYGKNLQKYRNYRIIIGK